MSEMRSSGVRKIGFPVLAGLLLLGGAGAQALGCGDDSGAQAQGSGGPEGAGGGASSSAAGTGGPEGAGGGASSSAAGTGGVAGSGGAGGAPCVPSYECEIEALSEETGKAYGDISLGASRVFWLREGGFSFRDKEPLNSNREDRLALLGLKHLAAESDDSIYYATTEDVGLFNVNKNTLKEVSKTTSPTGLTVHMDLAYWPSQADNIIYQGGPFFVNSLSDMAGVSPGLIASSQGMDQVYWTYQGPDPGLGTGGVKKLGGGDVVAQQNRPTGIAADGEDVYWITGDGAIHQYEGATKTVTNASPPVVGMQVSSGRIAVSAAHVYWLGPDTEACSLGCDCGALCGAVLRVPKADITQAPEVFEDMDWPVLKGLAVDATHVYWTTGGPESKLLRKAH